MNCGYGLNPAHTQTCSLILFHNSASEHITPLAAGEAPRADGLGRGAMFEVWVTLCPYRSCTVPTAALTRKLAPHSSVNQPLMLMHISNIRGLFLIRHEDRMAGGCAEHHLSP